MKSISAFLLLAAAISPALSQPRGPAINDSPNSAPLASRSNSVPGLCIEANELIIEQLAEISQLQAKNIPVPADLAGYFYAVFSGRKMLGCPSSTLLNSDGSSNSTSQPTKRSSEAADSDGKMANVAKACDVIRKQTVLVMDQMTVLKDNHIPIPPFIAGYYSVINDADKYLQCDDRTDNSSQSATSR